MKLEELTPGFAIYYVEYDKIVKYEYLCRMPVSNPINDWKHFIFIDTRIDEPVRLSKGTVEEMLNVGIFDLQSAYRRRIALLEERTQYLKNKLH